VPERKDVGLIKVSATSVPKSVASVIANAVIAGEHPKIRAIGASAVNQATKACAIAGGYVAPRGKHLAFVVGFDDVEGHDGNMISAMSWQPLVTNE